MQADAFVVVAEQSGLLPDTGRLNLQIAPIPAKCPFDIFSF
ncbi:hypothetical protein [Paenirhodobacter sp.]|jgi:hypothetical protein